MLANADFVQTSPNDYSNPLSYPHARDYAIRDFKTHLKKARKAKPASVNLTLAARRAVERCSSVRVRKLRNGSSGICMIRVFTVRDGKVAAKLAYVKG